jgi:hypothetical protein
VKDSGSALQHLQHIGACELRAKKAVVINLADVSDLVADRRDLTYGRLKTLLCIQRTAQTVTSILPNVRREEQGWELTQVEVVDDAQRLRSRRAGPERACEALAFTLRQRLLNPPRGRLAEACSVDLTDDGTQRALGLHNTLPHGLGTGQEPRRRERRGVWLAPELAERDTNDVRHPSPSLAEKLLVLHRLPSQRKGVLRAQAAPPIVVDGQLLAQARNVLGRALAANHVVLVPADVRQVRDLVNAATLADPACIEPSYRKEMVGFASRARYAQEGRAGSEEADPRKAPAFRERPGPLGMQVQREPVPSASPATRLETASSSRP